MNKCCKNQREDFAKQLLNILDDVVRETPELRDFIYPIKRTIREVRDGYGIAYAGNYRDIKYFRTETHRLAKLLEGYK